MSKPTASQSASNIMGRARGPRPRGFSGPVVKAKDPIGAIKRIWRYMERQKVALIIWKGKRLPLLLRLFLLLLLLY
ncbi:hypothetical protein ACA29_14120 [Lederbergia galactosidilytica]|uniref:Uncharacterized protein n=1 Tax=Lederbergia galactosidilytica TaxID=217031 RepID=A0A0Q9XT80_9BACI|nr:hypothetical protein ACA29_14120 [Lederbergia galactosidilytica]